MYATTYLLILYANGSFSQTQQLEDVRIHAKEFIYHPDREDIVAQCYR